MRRPPSEVHSDSDALRSKHASIGSAENSGAFLGTIVADLLLFQVNPVSVSAKE